MTCGTDNQGNSYLLDKLLTTKYPLGIVLMELAVQLGKRGATLRADWIPRLENEEADALTNWDFRHFDPKKRVEVDMGKLNFTVLNDLLESGEEYVAEVTAMKAKELASRAESGPARKSGFKGPKMSKRDPW